MMLEHAIDNARVSKLDPHQSLTTSDQWFDSNTLDTGDYQVDVPETAKPEALLDALLALESRITGHHSIKSCPYNGLTSARYGRRIWSSQGLDVQMLESRCTAYAYALAEVDDRNAMAGTGQIGRAYKALDLSKLATEVQAKTVDMLDGKPVPGGHYDIIFSVDCLASLLGVFSMAISGKSAMDGVSPWREKVGQSVAHASFSLVDRPDLSGFGYTLFDSEGVAASVTPIVTDGELSTLLHNGVTAAASGMSSTGHGSRGPKSTLGVSAHQLSVLPGKLSVKDAHAGQYLELTDLTGLHSGANAISGDFSFGASGYLCRDGERQQVVRGITVAGNFYEILHRLVIADDQKWNWQQSFLLPTLRFEQLVVSG